MVDVLCRFCGYEQSELNQFSSNEVLGKFYKILPVEITRDDANLSQSFCEFCYIKIVEFLEFFDRIAVVDQLLRRKADTTISVISKHHKADEFKKIKNGLTIKKIVNPTTNLHAVDPLELGKLPETVELSGKDDISIDLLSCGEGGSSDEKDKDKRDHIVKDISNPNYVCWRCRESFHTAALLKNHLFLASACRDADHICKYCNKTFGTRRKRVKHESLYECKESPVHHQCTNCIRKFVSPALFAIHRLKCSGEPIIKRLGVPFKCIECGEIFKSSTQLMKHTDNHAISKKIRKHLACEICGQTFDTKPLYYDHIRIHPEMAKFECDLCEKKFHTSKLLHGHKYQHSGIKSNICQDCGKAFVKRTSLDNHRRSEHTGETPFQCQICGANFPTRERLQIHQYKHIFKD